jgi:hypothetical protein
VFKSVMSILGIGLRACAHGAEVELLGAEPRVGRSRLRQLHASSQNAESNLTWIASHLAVTALLEENEV